MSKNKKKNKKTNSGDHIQYKFKNFNDFNPNEKLEYRHFYTGVKLNESVQLCSSIFLNNSTLGWELNKHPKCSVCLKIKKDYIDKKISNIEILSKNENKLFYYKKLSIHLKIK